MSNIDKHALRINAQLASSGKWIKESGDGWEAICSSDDQANSGFIIAHFEGPDAKENREFIQAANPATVLALLDELEAKDRRIEDEIARANREHHRGFMMACGHLKEHSNVHYADAAEMEIAALRNRIDELENAAAVKGE
ncbi:ead/Ea22-like family protein [Enterobacter hormaechei]